MATDADLTPEAVEAAISLLVVLRPLLFQWAAMREALDTLIAAARAGQEARSELDEQAERRASRNRADERGWLAQPINDAEIRDIRQDYGGRCGLNSVIIERMLRTIEAGQEARQTLAMLGEIVPHLSSPGLRIGRGLQGNRYGGRWTLNWMVRVDGGRDFYYAPSLHDALAALLEKAKGGG